MYKRPWIFIQNPFMTVTSGNYSLSVIISTYNDSALNGCQSRCDYPQFIQYLSPRSAESVTLSQCLEISDFIFKHSFVNYKFTTTFDEFANFTRQTGYT